MVIKVLFSLKTLHKKYCRCLQYTVQAKATAVMMYCISATVHIVMKIQFYSQKISVPNSLQMSYQPRIEVVDTAVMPNPPALVPQAPSTDVAAPSIVRLRSDRRLALVKLHILSTKINSPRHHPPSFYPVQRDPTKT